MPSGPSSTGLVLPSRRDVLAGGGAFFALGSSVHTARRSQARKRIGFVDDNLENFHANTFLQLARGPLQSRGFVIAGCTGLNEAAGRTWAEKNGVPYLADVKALNGAVDAFM